MFLYIHIPFCQSKCRYCSFSSFAWMSGEIEKYLVHLKSEIKDFLKKNNQNIESIYFGWWTPSLLSVEQIKDIIRLIRENSELNKNIEITLEANPENLRIDYIEWIKSAGINRLSMWIQSLNNRVLAEIGRKDKEVIYQALDNIKEVGFDNVGVDFIIWLPHEDRLWVSKNIDIILSKYSFIKHVSLYMLEWNFPKSWWDISIKQDEYQLEYEACIEVLNKHQITQYEISNFSVKWYECRHNKSYWNHREYRWFWVSAASLVWNKRLANSSQLSRYYEWVLDYEEELSEEDIELERIMFNIRTVWIDENIVKNITKLEELLQDNFLIKEDWIIRLTTKWVMICDYIIRELI